MGISGKRGRPRFGMCPRFSCYTHTSSFSGIYKRTPPHTHTKKQVGGTRTLLHVRLQNDIKGIFPLLNSLAIPHVVLDQNAFALWF